MQAGFGKTLHLEIISEKVPLFTALVKLFFTIPVCFIILTSKKDFLV